MPEEIETAVAIARGGGCGLNLSSFLSYYGLARELFEQFNSSKGTLFELANDGKYLLPWLG
ncbi:FAD binding domain-containing protein [Penicillium odoratum]|uniref:FAD binding domain-containing protein n=1 Tax=Penicillium odoratum TaxID=1167516 RepID=UPI0025470F2B|nr:FAD binding domain-containing protein [Penicillium odoratum]KAJ5772295.1 FAD binding domain-containing protein [Penicillium odoratum]